MMIAHVRDDTSPVVFVSRPYKRPRSQLFHIAMASRSPDPGLDAVLSYPFERKMSLQGK